MNEDERQSEKRKTIRIKVPRKPAAPRHSQVMAKAIPLPDPSVPEQTTNAVRLLFPLLLFPLVQIMIASVLAAMILDGGGCFQMVCAAALAYFGGFALMILRRREMLTATDKFLIRWGFPMLCVLSFFVHIVVLAM